jgi:hypothetical protein
MEMASTLRPLYRESHQTQPIAGETISPHTFTRWLATYNRASEIGVCFNLGKAAMTRLYGGYLSE